APGKEVHLGLLHLTEGDLIGLLQALDHLALDVPEPAHRLVSEGRNGLGERGVDRGHGCFERRTALADLSPQRTEGVGELLGDLLAGEPSRDLVGWLSKVLGLESELVQDLLDLALDHRQRGAWVHERTWKAVSREHGRGL